MLSFLFALEQIPFVQVALVFGCLWILTSIVGKYSNLLTSKSKRFAIVILFTALIISFINP